jgi:signal transduction histidine kinase
VFVRDRGVGFDPSMVDADRRGIRDSITGRLTRVAGGAAVISTPGEGTEVSMQVGRPRFVGEAVAS